MEKSDLLLQQDAKLHEEIRLILSDFISRKIDKTQKDIRVQEIADLYKNRPEIAAWVKEITEAALSVQ